MTLDLSQLDVFYGELTVNRALVYARLPLPAGAGDWSLEGEVRGPRCLVAQTLPVTSPLVDRGPGPTLLACATLSDPCFWSPDLPAIYDVTVHLLRGSEVVATARREIGLRALGIRDRHLSLEGKRWVLRGVSNRATSARSPREWHDQQAAYVGDHVQLKALAECSEWGALALVIVSSGDQQIIEHLRALSHFPGVGIVATGEVLPPGFNRSKVAPNLLLAQWLSPGHWLQPEPWADLLLVCADEPEFVAEARARSDLPLIAARFLVDAVPRDLPSARAACDALQRDLAPLGQFAGYVV